MTEKDYLDPKGYWGDPAGNFRRMSGDSIGAFWSCLFSNFWVPAEGRSSKPFKATWSRPSHPRLGGLHHRCDRAA